MSEQGIIQLAAVLVPSLTTLITAYFTRRLSVKHAAKQSILQMILEDKVAVMEGHLPENYQNILDEYDEYHKAHGNSYVTEKVEQYKKWYWKQMEHTVVAE